MQTGTEDNNLIFPKKIKPGDQPIVAIGASAGGINALRAFFKNVPEKSGLTYVVILHLSPDHESSLDEVLQFSTKIPVVQVKKRTAVQADTVYVISPNMHLEMEKGFINVSGNKNPEDRRAPIDIFFRTLGDHYGPAAVCIVFSGTGADGSMGLKRVKEAGGACFVQDPREAEFDEMPQNAIATNLVDQVLPAAEMPAKIISYLSNLKRVFIPEDNEHTPDEIKQAMSDIFKQLKIRTGHDFSNYKRATLNRRIERRMNIRNLDNLKHYAEHMKQVPEESVSLLKDLLISVTNFFRDKPVFNYLEKEVIPRLLKGNKAEDHVRVWIAGCATGEEAYSLAMLITEKLSSNADAPKVQIFATDIDEAAIAQARDGIYTINDAADISPERLNQFFTKKGDRYRVRAEIREMILFAQHNVLKDPPFSHMDLISCRNLMIYLNTVAQERVLNTFHFALKPEGWLVLGSSETTGQSEDKFKTTSREHHVYQSKSGILRPFPVAETMPALRLHRTTPKSPETENERAGRERLSLGDLHRRLLEEYAPPSVVINEEYDILHLSDGAGRYLLMTGGNASHNLLKLVLPDIRMELRSGLFRALQLQAGITIKGLKIALPKPEILNIHIRPVLKDDDPAKGLFLVIFETDDSKEEKEIVVVSHDDPFAKQLEEEVFYVKNQLRHSIEQHEFQSEELKASNEELQAMNEELRSAAEELETGKEELQSINEELHTVNQELKVKIEETTLSGDNLQNLINSVDIGTIFLDRNYSVRLYTPAAAKIFNLLPTDIARPITDITNNLVYHDLMEDAQKVLQKLQLVEREIDSTDGLSYLLRISPYRTEDERIDGVVMSFIDITTRKRMELAMHESVSRFRTLADAVPQLIWTNDTEAKANYFNQRWYEYTGLTYDQSYVLGWQVIVHPDDEPASSQKWIDAQKQEKIFDSEYRLRAHDGTYRWFIGRNVPLHNAEKKLIGWFGTATDINDIKTTQQNLRESEAKLRATMESATDYAIITTDVNGIIEEWNPGAETIFGYKRELVIGESINITFTAEDRAAMAPEKERDCAIKEGRAADERWHLRKTGERIYMSGVMAPITDEKLNGFVKVARELTQQKRAEEALRVSEERYRVALESAGMGAWDWDISNNVIKWNDEHYVMLGSVPDAVTLDGNILFHYIHPQDRATVAEAVAKALKSGEYSASFRIIRADTQVVRWMRGFGRVVETTGSKPVRMVGVMYDVTDQKEIEQQKEDFIGIAGHELRTPVTSIKAYANVLQDMLDETEEKRAAEIARKLHTQVDRLTELIRNVLDSSKITEGLLPLSKQYFDINILIAEKAEVLEHEAGGPRITLSFKEKEIFVKADPDRIGQVITNLITNAINYSEKGTKINISVAKSDTQVVVSVSDRGVGIDKVMQEHIFEKFFRIQHGAQLLHAGMGLGLYISAGIIKRHNGTISVQSEKGKGSTFTFTLPLDEIKRLQD